MQELDDVLGKHTGLPGAVLEYTSVVKRLVNTAKDPGFGQDSWEPLAALVDIDDFTRVGNFKEVMNWSEYVEFLTNWARSADWDCSFRRIANVSNSVYLELEERSRIGDYANVVNSASVFEFSEAGKIRRVDVYLQMALPEGGMLTSYDGVRMSE